MPLESLLQLVKTLSSRIDEHGSALRQSEALTRYALIDPLLRELGWDTEDPNMVIPEYRVPNNQIADYILQDNGHPVMVVESKKLDEPLQSGKALDQGILYCAHTGSKHFILTDGRRWEVYEASNTTPVISFDLKDHPAQVCLKTLALWQPSVETGQVSIGRTPLVQIRPDDTDVPDPPAPQTTGWQSISTLHPEFGASPPSEISFPDSSAKQIRYWVDVPAAVVEWLIENRILNESHCPIQYGENTILSTNPYHPDGRLMRHRKIGAFYMNRNYTGPYQIRNARLIVERAGQDPAQFKVRIS